MEKCIFMFAGQGEGLRKFCFYRKIGESATIMGQFGLLV